MIQEPGHLQFDDSEAKPETPKSPKAVAFDHATPDGAALHTGKQRHHAAKAHGPEPVFNDVVIPIAPAIDYARSNFPDLAKKEEYSLERKLRQLLPWQHQVVATWGTKPLDENASITTRAAQLINRFSEYDIGELVEKATAVARRGESNLLNRLFLRNKVISYKPALAVAKTQLMQSIKECSDHIAAVDPLALQLKINLVALVSAYEALTKPADNDVDATINSRRVLLQQAIHQAELTALQVRELKQQMAIQLSNVEQILMITIPAFEIADAAK